MTSKIPIISPKDQLKAAYKKLKSEGWKGEKWYPGAGHRVIGGIKRYYRSKMEANYAWYLQFLKEKGEIVHWQHEPHTFWFKEIERGTTSYLPDFVIIFPNQRIEYHEVKGYMDAKSKVKISRMSKYYPEIILQIIDANWFSKNRSSLKNVVPGWEQ